jgi:capsular polysaccharide biosynthesis protein
MSIQSDKEPSGFTYVSPLDLVTGLRRDPTIRGVIEGGPGGREVTRPGPTFHDDPDGAGLFSALGTFTISLPPAFTLTASEARQVGYRSFLSQGGFLFNDEALVNEEERGRFVARLGQVAPFPNEDTGLVPVDESRLFRLDARDRSVEYLRGEVVSLCSHEPSNYGAFILRVLPKLAGRCHLSKGLRLIGPLYHESMRSLYEMAGIPVKNIIAHQTNVIYAYEKVVIPSLRNPHFLVDQESLAFYADLRDRFGSRERKKKIFVSRLGWKGGAGNDRVMLNEEELARRLVARGFELVLTHAMTVRQQIEAFSSAGLIVGPSGSAMFNVVFSHPGTKVIDIESEPHWIFAHQNLFGSCGMDYGIFEARARDRDWTIPHKPFSVNVDALMARLSAL